MAGTPEAIARARESLERLARAQCTPGEIAASLWASHLVENRVEAQLMVREHADDIVAWRLAGKADVRVAAHDGAVGVAKLSPGQAASQVAWGKQHLGWDKQGADPAKQAQTETREGAAAQKLRSVG